MTWNGYLQSLHFFENIWLKPKMSPTTLFTVSPLDRSLQFYREIEEIMSQTVNYFYRPSPKLWSSFLPVISSAITMCSVHDIPRGREETYWSSGCFGSQLDCYQQNDLSMQSLEPIFFTEWSFWAWYSTFFLRVPVCHEISSNMTGAYEGVRVSFNKTWNVFCKVKSNMWEGICQ